ncbi:Alpha/beta hydrolase fold-5 [Vigna unguiculata]|uniref:Alpha/beta hydrolase fold-5 n=1 Tax=Vigna unguiculata TaxID=3917 RepID=A0A4D6NUB3_VIGUN|nr:Alpha/beta hydrolase fold-5 [Vigna unguiculata]
MAEKEAIEEAHSKLRSKFLQVIRFSTRRRCEFFPIVRRYKKAVSRLYENSPPTKEEMEIMESCPKMETENLEELLQEENFYLEAHSGRRIQWLPVVIYKLKESDESDEEKRRPAVVFLHSMNKNKDFLRPLLKAYASRGYVAISVDTCYHGERATNTHAYRDALTYSWASGKSKPFIYEVVYDLMRLADFLTEDRDDIDPSRIGITGISLGGIHAWFAALADTRYSVVVPLIGVRGFRWAIDNDQWKPLADDMEVLFDVARHNLGKDRVDKEVVEKVFDRIAPDLTSEYDAPYSIPAIAPRPLLIINGAEDPLCPVAGLEVPISKATQAYEAFQCLDNFKFMIGSFYTQFIAEAGVGHQITRLQVKESCDWFDRFLKPDT